MRRKKSGESALSLQRSGGRPVVSGSASQPPTPSAHDHEPVEPDLTSVSGRVQSATDISHAVVSDVDVSVSQSDISHAVTSEVTAQEDFSHAAGQ